MIKARFVEKQPKVKQTGEYFQICLNEKKIEVLNDNEDSDSKVETMYEYDFNEFKDGSLDIDTVKKDVKEYIDYEPMEKEKEIELNVQEQIAEVKATQETMAQAVQDIALMVMEV